MNNNEEKIKLLMSALTDLVICADNLNDGQLAFNGESEKEFLESVKYARNLINND